MTEREESTPRSRVNALLAKVAEELDSPAIYRALIALMYVGTLQTTDQTNSQAKDSLAKLYPKLYARVYGESCRGTQTMNRSGTPASSCTGLRLPTV